jgi:glutathione S-transferase
MTQVTQRHRLHGRSSSPYTRVVRVFAHELGIRLELLPILDMARLDEAGYGGNPALKLPTLRVGEAMVLGTEHICRHLALSAGNARRIAWPEDALSVASGNAQELVWHGMAAQVQWVMASQVGQLPPDNPYLAKGRAGFEGALRWLDVRLDEALAGLPAARDFSLLEVTLHCLVEHLVFRKTLGTQPYPALRAFAARWAGRPSSQATPYQFDAPPAP